MINRWWSAALIIIATALASASCSRANANYPYVVLAGEELEVGVHGVSSLSDPPVQDEQLISLTVAPGMIVVNPEHELVTLWVGDLDAAVSIAFLGLTGVVQELHDYEGAASDRTRTTAVPWRRALVLRHGWFRDHDVKVGDQVKIPAATHELLNVGGAIEQL